MSTIKAISQTIAVGAILLMQSNFAIAGEFSSNIELASIQNSIHNFDNKSGLTVDLRSECTSEGTLFSIINRGEKWPQPLMLKLLNVGDKSVISERRIRLASQQQLSFMVSNDINNGNPVAIWLDPQWYSRPLEFDAQRGC